MRALQGLDAILDLNGDADSIEDLAKQIGIEDASGLMAVCEIVRSVLGRAQA